MVEGAQAAVEKEKALLNLRPMVSTRKISDRVRADPAAKNLRSLRGEIFQNFEFEFPKG